MKKLFLLLVPFVLLQNNLSAQIRTERSNEPVLFNVTSHDSNIKELPAKSFYERKADWQYIIDTTWGPGLPLAQKQQIFDAFRDGLNEEFDGFLSLGLTQQTWEDLWQHYYNKIDENTSRGRFSAIMNYFSLALRDWHTYAFDNQVFSAPLNPGVPLLHITAWADWKHAGAVVTVTPDSTILVLRVAPNHPLNLEPGDIVLGYNGVKWIDLLGELMDAELPIFPTGGGSEISNNDAMFVGSIMNWHLFDTIDILKYAAGDTVHLDLTPMVNFNTSSMSNNEQMPIPGISFPPPPLYPNFNTEPISYGIIQNTNIGYLYIFHHEDSQMDQKMFEAVDSLKNTDGLIIDMRYTYGGWSLWQQAFGILANEEIYTMIDAFRCGPNNWTLCIAGDSVSYRVAGNPPNKYERPIALLTGPFCISMGDINAYRLSHLEIVRTFGKPTCGSLGENRAINNFPDWSINYSIEDPALVSDHSYFLNRKELSIDYPVWHNKDAVAQGKDAVVEAALGWINNLVYGHDVVTDNTYAEPGVGAITISASVENPNANNVTTQVFIRDLNNSIVDSLELVETESGSIWEGTWSVPNYEDIFKLDIKAADQTTGETFTIKNVNRITTAGPIEIDSVLITYNSFFDRYSATPFVRNSGQTFTVEEVSISMSSDDSLITSISSTSINIASIAPGEVVFPTGSFTIRVAPGFSVPFKFNFEIKSNGWLYWKDSLSIVTDVEDDLHLPVNYSLNQNYPNPFNPTTTIKYAIPERSLVELKVYDILGNEVASLINEEQDAGYYELNFNAANLSSGVYFYRLKAVGPSTGSGQGFIETKKMLLLK